MFYSIAEVPLSSQDKHLYGKERKKKKAHEDSHCWRFHSRSDSQNLPVAIMCSGGCFFLLSFSETQQVEIKRAIRTPTHEGNAMKCEWKGPSGRPRGTPLICQADLDWQPWRRLQSWERVRLTHDHDCVTCEASALVTACEWRERRLVFHLRGAAEARHCRPLRRMIMHKQQKGCFVLWFFLSISGCVRL